MLGDENRTAGRTASKLEVVPSARRRQPVDTVLGSDPTDPGNRHPEALREPGGTSRGSGIPPRRTEREEQLVILASSGDHPSRIDAERSAGPGASPRPRERPALDLRAEASALEQMCEVGRQTIRQVDARAHAVDPRKRHAASDAACCVWPPDAPHGSDALAARIDSMNDSSPDYARALKAIDDERAAAAAGGSAVAGVPPPNPPLVIAMSHMLPRQQLVPLKRHLFVRQLVAIRRLPGAVPHPCLSPCLPFLLTQW